MKLAIATDGQKVSKIDLICEMVAIIEIVEGQVLEQSFIDTSAYSRELLGEFIKSEGADAIITGSIDNDLLEKLEALKLLVVPNIEGDIDSVLNDYIKGKLTSDKSSCSGCVSCTCGHK